MKQKLTAVLLASVLCFGTSCSFSGLSTFDGYLKIAGPVLLEILNIVALAKGIPVPSALVAKINADQAAVTSLANSIEKTAQGDLPNTCAAFNAAVSTFASDLGAIEQLGNIGPNTSGEIGAIVAIAQTAIQGIESPLAQCQSSPNSRVAMQRLSLAAVTVKSPNDVLRRFNAVVDSKHRVHLHSLPVRVASFGRLQ